MNRKEKIKDLLERLTDRFQSVTGTASQLEIDSMKSMLRELYDEVSALNRPEPFIQEEIGQQDFILPEPAPVNEVDHEMLMVAAEIEEPVVQKESPIEKREIKPEPVEIKVPQPAELKARQQPEEIQTKPQPSEIISKTEPSQKKKSTNGMFAETTTVAESFTGKKTLHDKMSSSPGSRSVADHLQRKPLTDLKKSIGVNEKYVFVNELFGGNHQQFNKSLEQLNSFSSFDAASSWLVNELAEPMKWDTKSKAFTDLNELVRRRFNG